MSLQPKTRKYRLSFRNKMRINKSFPLDVRLRKLRNNNYFKAYSNSGCPEFCSQALNRKSQANFTDRVSQISMLPKSNQSIFQNFVTLRSNSNLVHQLLKFKLDIDSILINEQMDFSSLTPSQKSLTTASHPKQNQAQHTSAAIDKVRFGSCGFYFCSSGTISAKFIETIRLIVARKLKKTGRFWIRVCPDTPVTARSAETRMGRGKGAISHYEAKVRSGQMFMEFSGVPEESIRQIYQQVRKKTAIPINLLY